MKFGALFRWVTISTLLHLCLFLPKSVGQCNQLYEWTAWTSFAGNSANGTIQYGGQTVGVDMTANYGFGSTPGIYNFGAFSGFGGTIPNTTVPFTTWAAGPGGVTTMCFSQTVTNPVLLIASLGNTGNHVTIEFSLPYSVVYDGGGMTFVNSTTIIGAEGYGIIEFPGDFDCVTIYSSTPEYYTNITWGLHPPLFQVDITGIPNACNEVNLTASGGNTYSWSGGMHPNQASNTFTESGNYFLTVTDNNGCTVLTSVEVDVYEAAQTNLYDEICEGTPFYFQGNPVTQSGTYSTTLQTSHGCDSTVTLELVVYPSFQQIETQKICHGQSYFFHGQNLTDAGQYKYTGQTLYGCDSLEILQLQVLPNSEINLSMQVCSGDTIRFGDQTITTTGTYTQLLSNHVGCDSLVSLEIQFIPSVQVRKDTAICQGDTLVFHQQKITKAGTYLSQLSTKMGCDSLVQLHLTINNAPITNQSETICGGEKFIFQGTSLTESGEYIHHFPSSKGCDSLVILKLNVIPTQTTRLMEQICQGETRNFGGKNLTQSGIYRDTIPSTVGCDSIVVLELKVNSSFQTELKAEICEGETFAFQDKTLSNPGEYAVSLPSQYGCDSIVNLSLTVWPQKVNSLMADICPGQSYSFGGKNLQKEGIYKEIYSTIHGCDSTVWLTLHELPYKRSSQQVQICDGESYVFHGKKLESPGLYRDTLSSAFACDSIVELQLIVSLPTKTNLEARICDGETFLFQGSGLQKEGQYTNVATNSFGCDSVVSLTLKVFPTFSQELLFHLCPGESVNVGQKEFSQTGMWTIPLKTSQGCDSITLVTVAVDPEYTSQQKIESESSWTWPVNGVTYDQSGIYIASFQTEMGCDSIHILDLRIIPVKKWYAPNIITGNGPNGRFSIFGNDQLELVRVLRVYDRWGNLVADLESLTPGSSGGGWDGRTPGGDRVPGVYVYSAEIMWKDGSKEWISGDVTLMR